MTIPWPDVDSASALIFGVLTLAVGWLSYRAGIRSHDSQIRIDTLSLAGATRLILDELANERGDLFKRYQSLYAAQGGFLSGAMEVKKREFDGFAETIDALRSELTAMDGIDRVSGRKLETALVQVRSIHGRAFSIKEKFSACEKQLREDAAAHQAQALNAFRSPPRPGQGR